MDNKVSLSFAAISEALREFPLPEVDRVVGIGRGGVVPASLIAHQLQRELSIVWVNYRNDDNQPAHERPQWQDAELPYFDPGDRILLVDDVAVSGQTLAAVKERLSDFTVTTLVLKGTADLVVFPTIATCVHWPWKPNEQTANLEKQNPNRHERS